MRGFISMLALCCSIASPAFAEVAALATTAARERPEGALDSVILADGSVVRGEVVTADSIAVVIRLRSGEEQTIPRAQMRMLNRWAALPVAAPPLEALAATPAAAPRTRWYGWQTLGSDAIALALVPVAIVEGGDSSHKAAAAVVIAISGATYLFGAPLIHKLHHEEWTTTWYSFGLRVGLPLGGGIIGALAGIPLEQSCESNRNKNGFDLDLCATDIAATAILGGAIGVVSAIIVDAAAFAYEPVVATAPQISFAPLIFPHGSPTVPQGGTGLALAGRF